MENINLQLVLTVIGIILGFFTILKKLYQLAFVIAIGFGGYWVYTHYLLK